jgi:hypothetical protein
VAIGGALYLLQAIKQAEGYHGARAKQGRETTSAVAAFDASTVASDPVVYARN